MKKDDLCNFVRWQSPHPLCKNVLAPLKIMPHLLLGIVGGSEFEPQLLIATLDCSFCDISNLDLLQFNDNSSVCNSFDSSHLLGFLELFPFKQIACFFRL